MSVHQALHPLSYLDRLHLPRQDGGRRLPQIRQTVEEHALKAVFNEELLKVNELKSEYLKKELKSRLEWWPLHSLYLKDIKDKADNNIIWNLLNNGE